MLQSNAILSPTRQVTLILLEVFLPLGNGIPTRLTIPDIQHFINQEVSEIRIPLMSNQVSINLNDVVHLAISGSSGSGKSYFLEYLIRCIRK